MQQITSYQISICLMLAFILILSSCSDNSIKSEEDPSLKKEKVLEKAEILFPDELVTLYDERIETQSIDLDSLQAEMDGLIDTLNKYSSVDEFRAAVKKQYDAMSSEMAKRGKSMSKAPCVNNFGLGFARSVEVFAGVSKGIGVKIAGQLSTRGGGGSDYIYDFVNMDRAVYTYSFCGVGAGLGIGAGGGLRKNTGFTGLRKWFWNIKPNQQSVKDRFEGSGRSYALGVSTALNKVAGIEVGASVGYVHEVEWWNDSHVVENMAQCPVAFTSKPVHGGVKELTFSASFASSVGPSVEVVALFDGEIAGTHRTYVEDSYTDYRSITGRIGSSIKMAKELILPDPSEFITTGGPAPLAAATVVILGAFDPSDCPPPDQVPNVETDEVAEVEMTTSLVRGSILEDGGQPITEMGVCWDKNQNPTLEDNCQQLDGDLGDFEVNITDLTPDTKYYVRAFATNEIGTGYGNQLNFTTDTETSLPSVSTSSTTSITTNKAESGGEVSDDGGAPVTNRGVCWDTSENPTTNDECSSDGEGTGSFTSRLTNLSPETKYYIRAYAINSEGTAYGNQRDFTTDSKSNSGDWQRDTETEVVEVTSATGRVWMDRNLGASRAATSMTDEEAYGDLYQWGRPADGHQKRNSGTTTTLSRRDQPGHGDFILSTSSPWDWRSPQNDKLWQGINGINNPCPQGYRLPTSAEWDAEMQSWNSRYASGAFASQLKLPVAGRRFRTGGSIIDLGTIGDYWSSTVDENRITSILFEEDRGIIFDKTRSLGRSVRCIKD